MYTLPEKKDFMTGGKFSTSLIYRNRLPTELMSHIFPDYTEIIFKEKPAPSKKTIRVLADYCISTRKAAKKEEREMKQKQKKEMEIKMLEENIKEYFRSYYKNMLKNCTCQQKTE
jgi:pantothenate kinase-related protein Tda10